MLMPGFSSARVPVQVRLFIAVAVTLALSPLLVPVLRAALPQVTPDAMLALIVSETVVGALIGLMGRLFFLALQFMATAAAMFIGFSNMPGAPIEDTEPVPAFAALITLTATLLFFLTDQHWEVLRALARLLFGAPRHRAAGGGIQPGQARRRRNQRLPPGAADQRALHRLRAHHQLHGRHRQQAHAADPRLLHLGARVLAGGFILLYFTIGESLRLFMMGFMGWLARG